MHVIGPPGAVAFEQTKLNENAAVGGAQERRRPYRATLTDQVHNTRLWLVRCLVNYARHVPTPSVPWNTHGVAGRADSSGISRRGFMSPRPRYLLHIADADDSCSV